MEMSYELPRTDRCLDQCLAPQKVLMLGWEYPPHISGGLGTACQGLTRELAARGVAIDFVVPQLHGGETDDHMNIRAADGAAGLGSPRRQVQIQERSIPAFLQPYWTPTEFDQARTRAGAQSHYGSDLFQEVERYTDLALKAFRHQTFDLIHAHDWMTYAAGVALSEVSGKPLITHVHSLECDRSGSGGDSRISQIERFGLERAARVVAVSHLTKALISSTLGINEAKVRVVHNGVLPSQLRKRYRQQRDEKLVLFMGRITFQKGPEYFVEAAKHVLNELPDATFVMAGSGDMLSEMMDLTKRLEIAHRFTFPGFLKGAKVEEMYARAAVYVMPSVSEPFGIAPLEAINCDTPVIISKQSGVSEVLHNAFRCDFWDTRRLARQIVAALTYPEIRQDMVMMAREEIRRIGWEQAAEKMIDVYREVVH